jgi:hypothetical protein
MSCSQHKVGHCKKDNIAKQDESVVYAARRNIDGEKKHLNNTDAGEPGWLGNPYPEAEYGRKEAVARYYEDFMDRFNEDPEFRQKLAELKANGVDFACWCQSFDEEGPLCHAEVVAKVVDGIVKAN